MMLNEYVALRWFQAYAKDAVNPVDAALRADVDRDVDALALRLRNAPVDPGVRPAHT